MRSVEILIPYTRVARIIRGDLATAEIDDPVLTERCGVLAPYRRGRLTSGRLAQPGVLAKAPASIRPAAATRTSDGSKQDAFFLYEGSPTKFGASLR